MPHDKRLTIDTGQPLARTTFTATLKLGLRIARFNRISLETDLETKQPCEPT